MTGNFSNMQFNVLGAVLYKLQPRIDESIQQYCSDKRLMIPIGDDEIIRVEIPMREFGVGDTHYAQLREAMIKFASIPVSFMVNDKVLGECIEYTNFMSVRLPQRYERNVVFSIHGGVANKLLDMSTGFTKYKWSVLKKLSSVYSVQFYWKCCSWAGHLLSNNAKKRYFTMKMDVIRNWLGVQDKYLSWYDFNNHLLQVVAADLEQNADVWFKPEPVFEKEGDAEPREIRFYLMRHAMTSEQAEYLARQSSYLFKLLSTHYAFTQEEWDEEIKPYILYLNVDDVIAKTVEVNLYVLEHEDMICDKHAYMKASLMMYLTPDDENVGQIS